MAASTGVKDVFYFDIDNCLYSRNKRIHTMMTDLIDDYFMSHLSLSQEDANHLHMKYYKDYGLAIEGLVRHHKIDPMDYNTKVDDALPLEDVITPDPDLRRLLLAFDRSKIRLWLFTNAYKTHGSRVVKLLGVDDLFDGITFCDYAAQKFVCKPHSEMFELAQNDAQVSSPQHCYFVDDSYLNCQAARALGWTTVHLVERSEPLPLKQAAKYQIRSLEDLKTLFPQFFKLG